MKKKITGNIKICNLKVKVCIKKLRKGKLRINLSQNDGTSSALPHRANNRLLICIGRCPWGFRRFLNRETFQIER